MRKILDAVALTAAMLAAVAGFILIRNNLPAFSPLLPSLVLWLVYFSLYPVIGFLQMFREPGNQEEDCRLSCRLGRSLLFFAGAALLPVLFLKAAVTDYYQPFSLYDVPIYITLVSWLIFILLFLFLGIRSLAGRRDRQGLLLWPMLALLPILLVPVFQGLSNPRWSDDVENVQVLFHGGDGGYSSYRIPGLLVIPAGSRFADGSIEEGEVLLAFAEARRDGSLDQGDIDLVMRRSINGGKDWSPSVVVRRWENGRGKIGDPTPLFDPVHGTVILAMGAQAHGEPYETWLMDSVDGGRTWSKPYWLGEGSPGPGHGTVLTDGPESGRLVIPAHKGNNGYAWISENGEEWRKSAGGYTGNESLIAAPGSGILVYTSRVPRSVARPHPRMEKLFGISRDGGETWEEYEDPGVVTPICMSGFTADEEGILWFVNPATIRTRARLSLRRSGDNGIDWSEPRLLFSGPAGYADLVAGEKGTLYILAENGRVEYDERITFALVNHADDQ